ncbi:hypothetical protein Gorai_012049 [Gossypium raimondii]|uniref:Uncharacterized protein n=1 Tax=Gossypium raimondii TaxID=29730 RepID=A0A7J8Q207_GOSRA|nr:hypothetical protein [Gossypium raimondii]
MDLLAIKNSFACPWIIGGDFNTMRNRSDRSSCVGLVNGSREFNSFTDNCKPAVVHWAPPLLGWATFNVSSVAKEDEAGCGKVLRDGEGVPRSLFSRPIDAIRSETTEAWAIKSALKMYIGMG